VEALLAASKYKMPTIVAPELGVPPSLLLEPAPSSSTSQGKSEGNARSKERSWSEEVASWEEPATRPTTADAEPARPALQVGTSFPFGALKPIQTNGVSSGPSPLSPHRSVPSTPLLPETLTDSQLHSMSRITRDGIEERLKLLENVQHSIDKCTLQLRQALDVLPEEQPQSLDKGKAPVEGVHAVNGPS
jgi:hypothetical protein